MNRPPAERGKRAALPLRDAVVAGRLVLGLPFFFRRSLGPEQARALLQRRLRERTATFVELVRNAVYGNRGSPYRHLLAAAGCEFGDFAALVQSEGIEQALETLYRQGVYLTVDEFKGRQPAQRGSATIWIDPNDLRNPGARFHFLSQTSGSRGPQIQVPVDLRHVKERLVDLALVADARGGRGWDTALWGVPGGAAIINVLLFSGIGQPPRRWFSQIDPNSARLHSRYRVSVGVLRRAAALTRVRLPEPEFVPVRAPLPIVRWMATTLEQGRTPHLYAYTSTGVGICRAAAEAGIAIAGARLTLTGEPITETRMSTIRAVGAEATTNYGSNEAGGFIAYGCGAPEVPDDVHLHHDLHAVIKTDGDRDGAAFPKDALLISSLRPTAPLMLLNVSMGDRADMATRDCDCGLGRLGWTTHLQTIRSFEKLTACGITFFDTDVVRVLEDVLPKRFGGGPTDYQLVEQEAPGGEPRLHLVIHPGVGPLDEGAVANAFLDALGSGSGGPRVAELVWREAQLLSVQRREPDRTPSGKVLHLHVSRRVGAEHG